MWEGFPFSLAPYIVILGAAMFLWGMVNLGVLLFRWACQKTRRGMYLLPFAVLLLAPPGTAEASAEVRRHCAARTMYQSNADHASTWWGARIWSMELCAYFEQTGDTVSAMPPATLTWTPRFPYSLMWNSDGCDAWISPQTADGSFHVMGNCTLRMAVFPFLGVVKGDVIRRTIWTGFRIGPDGFLDYLYPERVDFANETNSDPLPFPDEEPMPN